MAAFLPDLVVQAKTMEASEDAVSMETEDAPAEGTKSVVNGDISEDDSKDKSVDVTMADDVRTAETGKAKDCGDQGKVGYLTVSDGRLVLKPVVSDSHSEGSVVNGCESGDDVKEKTEDPDIPEKTTVQPNPSTIETLTNEATEDVCDKQKNSSSLLDSSGIASLSGSQVDSDEKIQSSDTLNSSEPLTCEASSPGVKDLTTNEDCSAPSSLTESSADSLHQGSNTGGDKKEDSGSPDKVDVDSNEAEGAGESQGDGLTSAGDGHENSSKGPAETDEKDLSERNERTAATEEKDVSENNEKSPTTTEEATNEKDVSESEEKSPAATNQTDMSESEEKSSKSTAATEEDDRSESRENSLEATGEKDVSETSQNETSLSEQTSVGDQTVAGTAEKEGPDHSEDMEVDDDTPCNESENKASSEPSEAKAAEQPEPSEAKAAEQPEVASEAMETEQPEAMETEESEDVGTESGDVTSIKEEPDEKKTSEDKTMADEVSTDKTTDTSKPDEEEMPESKAYTEKECADDAPSSEQQADASEAVTVQPVDTAKECDDAPSSEPLTDTSNATTAPPTTTTDASSSATTTQQTDAGTSLSAQQTDAGNTHTTQTADAGTTSLTKECESQTPTNPAPSASPAPENNPSETVSKPSGSCSTSKPSDSSSTSKPSDSSSTSKPSDSSSTSKPSNSSSTVSVGTDTSSSSKKPGCSSSSISGVSTGKSTARKSVPGGSLKSKLSKVTARKTGQPQVMCSSKDSKEGTIRIFNLHPNSNITLKLSELEKVLKPPRSKEATKVTALGSEGTVKKEAPLVASKETSTGDEEMNLRFDTSNLDNSPGENSADESTGAHSSLKMQHRRRRKKGGTYDFPGGKRNSKKKRGSGFFSSSTFESVKEDGAVREGFRLMKKFYKKSPHKQCTVMELFKNQPFHKQNSTHDTPLSYRPSSDKPPPPLHLGRATVSQMLQQRRSPEGVAVSDSSVVAAQGTVPVYEVGLDRSIRQVPAWRAGDLALNSSSSSGSGSSSHSHHTEGGGKGSMVQKLFITKEGLVSSVKVEDASERDNVPHENVLKRKFPGSIVGPASCTEASASKKNKLEGSDGTQTTSSNSNSNNSKQPMVMVVAQHSQNAPGLRSILPKPHMAAVAVTAATSTVPTSTTPVMVSAGQKLLLAAPPMLMKPGTKVALVPVSMTGKSSFSLLPASMVPGGKGRTGVPASAVSSLPKVLNFQPSGSGGGKNADALRSLLAPSNGPQPKTVSMVPGSIPAASSQRISIPSSVLAQARVLTSCPTSASLSSSSSSSSSSLFSSKGVGTETKVTSSLSNGPLPVTPPKTPEGEAAATEGMAAAPAPDSDVIPLCCCKIVGTFFNKDHIPSTGVIYCQALDSVDGKALGCCNKVSNLQLVRPGVKIPFMAVCEVHRKRIKMHQCCPGCGHFCTQGKFYQCRQDGSTVHNFHKQCQTERDGRLFCPHCGEESGQVEVTLTLNEPQQRQTSEQIRANLRKSLSKARIMPSTSHAKKKTSESKAGVSVTISDSNKTISSDGLPVGPDRNNLEKLLELCVLKMERPKKYRVLPKNMYHPALEGDMDKVFYMLMDGMDPNQTCGGEQRQTVLHAAVNSGNLALVYMLVQAGACLHTPDKFLKTPLMCAAEKGHLAIFQFLAKAGARLEDRGEDRMTCLHSAAKAGHMDIIQYILDIHAIDVNATDEGGWTPLMWATESQLVNVVRYLVSRGGDPNIKDNEENNALHWAAFAGSVEITELFLNLGCELDSPNEHGDRPLHIAARQDHYEVVVILLARGANVDLKNNKDETPVSCCINPETQVCMALKVNKQLRSFAAKLSRTEKLVHRDVSIGRENNPIACVNAVDDEPHPTDYLYVNHNVETQDLNINNVITSLQSCRCKDDCSSVFCVCSRSSVKCWFDKYGRLLDDFNMLDPPLIFECNRACRCWVNCNNRVVQNGITVRMQVFRTNGRGWGVRSLMDIPKGTFICEYIGELISDQEADRREDDSYLFDLDNKDGDTYCLDARKYGNVARFINHLCEPNLVPVKVFVEHQDLRFPRICFFSSRHIKAYEELDSTTGRSFGSSSGSSSPVRVAP